MPTTRTVTINEKLEVFIRGRWHPLLRAVIHQVIAPIEQPSVCEAWFEGGVHLIAPAASFRGRPFTAIKGEPKIYKVPQCEVLHWDDETYSDYGVTVLYPGREQVATDGA